MKLSDGIIPFTEEWAKCRMGKLTASNMHRIFVSGRSKTELIGQGGRTYINQKIGEILTQVMHDDVPETDDIMRGRANEPDAILRYSEITGEKVEDSLLFQYNAIACGTTDGEVLRSDEEIKRIIEAKSPRPHKHIQVLAVDAPIELKDIDPIYWHQPQTNMLITGCEEADFISYNDEIEYYDLQIRIVRMYPDMNWRKDFVERVDFIAGIMDTQLTKILKAPERNLAYRLEKNPEAVKNLQNAIDSLKNLSI
jgi:hypothetical protein